MDICHLKNAELEPKHQKYKGRVVLQRDIVRYDSGAYAEFTEQGSSASKMTTAKVMDVIARLPRYAGQATDAVSAYTHVKMEDVPRLLENSRVRMSRYSDTFSSTTQVGKILVKHRRPVVPLDRNLYGHPLAGLLWERQFEVLLGPGWEKVPNWECFLFTENKDCSYRYMWMVGRLQNMAPMCEKLMEHVDLDEPTSFLDHVYLEYTQRSCKPNEIIIEEYREMFESRISGSHSTQFQGLAWMISTSKEELETVGELSNVLSDCLDIHACTWL